MRGFLHFSLNRHIFSINLFSVLAIFPGPLMISLMRMTMSLSFLTFILLFVFFFLIILIRNR
jgi:hypothetical protein